MKLFSKILNKEHHSQCKELRLTRFRLIQILRRVSTFSRLDQCLVSLNLF